ncbi:hypothetical protein DFH08DRAFT_811388 [Mycena albidolilacea]|uniref:Uncharacterized protein n=1 Tax=Mycena albidolilacea TaxID=1033008 RepID=A0AAD6ZWS7_9AGAR|nr:hypothetical protein DFH08DRAFT_811388 [Mycena albidolilacea]
MSCRFKIWLEFGSKVPELRDHLGFREIHKARNATPTSGAETMETHCLIVFTSDQMYLSLLRFKMGFLSSDLFPTLQLNDLADVISRGVAALPAGFAVTEDGSLGRNGAAEDPEIDVAADDLPLSVRRGKRSGKKTHRTVGTLGRTLT